MTVSHLSTLICARDSVLVIVESHSFNDAVHLVYEQAKEVGTPCKSCFLLSYLLGYMENETPKFKFWCKRLYAHKSHYPVMGFVYMPSVLCIENVLPAGWTKYITWMKPTWMNSATVGFTPRLLVWSLSLVHTTEQFVHYFTFSRMLPVLPASQQLLLANRIHLKGSLVQNITFQVCIFSKSHFWKYHYSTTSVTGLHKTMLCYICSVILYYSEAS